MIIRKKTLTNKTAHQISSITTRKDNMIELPWYPQLKYMTTKANDGKGWDVILTGPASSGKTTGAYMLAHDLGYEIIVQQCHRRVEIEEFRGTRSIVPGKSNVPITGFDPGTLTRAVQRCDEIKGVVFLIDEINLVDPAMLAVLNNLTQRDAHSAFVVPELQKTYPRPSNLIIIGTMNPEYLGTNSLSEAFLSRIVKIECPMLDIEQVRNILSLKFPSPKHAYAVHIVARIMGYLETCRQQDQHQWEPDLRTMQQLLDLWISEEPTWNPGQPLNTLARTLDTIVGPKIGWRGSFFEIRKAITNAICTSVGGKLVEDIKPAEGMSLKSSAQAPPKGYGTFTDDDDEGED